MFHTPFAHNLYLDFYRTAGVIPFVGMLLYTGFFFYTLVRFMRTDALSLRLRTVGAVFALCLWVSFLTEPVLEGRPLNLWIWLFFGGYMRETTAAVRGKVRHVDFP